MRFWFEHSSEVSLREQVVTQVTLGILSGDLAPGERLPSIRELARRFGLHPNTVSAGYRQLEAENWVHARRGSGVYVRTSAPGPTRPEDTLERLLRNLFSGARRLGLTDEQIVARVAAWSAGQEPLRGATRLLLVEPDPELRRIVLAELREALAIPESLPIPETLPIPVDDCAPDQVPTVLPPATLLVCLPSKAAALCAATAARVVTLPVRSIPASLAHHLPAGRDGLLVGVASRWPEFLRFAHTMLVATGFAPDALVLRNPGQKNWHLGLETTAAILCDLPTATELADLHPAPPRIVFRILAESVAKVLFAESCQAPQPVDKSLTHSFQTK